MLGFYYVNDNKKLDRKVLQVMCCMFCHNNIVNAYNMIITQVRKWMISYYKTNEITTLEKHVNANYVVIANKFEEKISNLMKRVLEKELEKKKDECKFKRGVMTIWKWIWKK